MAGEVHGAGDVLGHDGGLHRGLRRRADGEDAVVLHQDGGGSGAGERRDDALPDRVVATLKDSRSPAVLMQNHGVFTIGASGKAAVKAAVMTEDVARTVHLSRQLGETVPIAQADIDSLYARYQNVYGQR